LSGNTYKHNDNTVTADGNDNIIYYTAVDNDNTASNIDPSILTSQTTEIAHPIYNYDTISSYGNLWDFNDITLLSL